VGKGDEVDPGEIELMAQVMVKEKRAKHGMMDMLGMIFDLMFVK